MKKAITFLLGAACIFSASVVNVQQPKTVVNAQAYYTTNQEEAVSVNSAEALAIKGKSAYLMDFSSQTPIYYKNERERLPIASMCKIMTLILAFEAIDSGALAIDEEIMVSERAASMGGSQVFLEANAKYLVKDLIKSIVVCSANDSCVALAERIAGGEEIFTARMNEKAKQLGANDTLFANCTGLPKEPQYSCAKDVAVMLKELLSHNEYYEYGSVWMDKFAHPQGRFTEITNTNKLVRFYDGCDGGKTGFTNQAGFCLAATAKRNDMRIISVVIGEESSANRFADVRCMFDYAFANYCVTPIVEAEKVMEENVPVSAGKTKSLKGYPVRSSYAFSRRGEKADVRMETQYKEGLRAPINKGDIIGEIVVYKDGVEMDRIPLAASENVEFANFFDRLGDVARGWNG